MGELARERAKLLAGEINCWHAGCFVATAHQKHPRRWIYEVGLRPRGSALTLTFIYSMQNSFISGRDVSVKVKILIWGLWEDTTSTQPLLSSSFITSSSSWPSRFPSRHLSTCIPLRFFRFSPGSICLKVTAHSQRSQSTSSPKLCLFQLLSGLQSLYSNPKNTTTSPRLRLTCQVTHLAPPSLQLLNIEKHFELDSRNQSALFES